MQDNTPAGPAAGPVETANDLVVHEWGTFLGMNGSDGSAVDGMYHEEHALPQFVHSRSRDQLRLPSMLIKGETPVIYFYTPRPLNVRVGVGFPQGIWTQWYPQAAVVKPSMVAQAAAPDRLKDGRICWYAEVIPPSLAAGGLPATRGDALWNFARDVDAAFVKTTNATTPEPRTESERFLFYRGLGQVRLPLQAETRDGGTLTLDDATAIGAGIRHIFVLRVEDGRGAFEYRPSLARGGRAAGAIPSMERSLPLTRFTEVVADALAARLEESGLFAKEARAMVNTWKTSYFRNEGIRVLFILPQSWTDAFIPMTIAPRPRQTVRVMVGRLELLSPERERRAEAAIRDLADRDPARRQPAFAYLREQGRYVEPIVRRVARTTGDEGVRTLCRRLLMTDFVTELRAAVHDASDGRRRKVDPLEIRMHLGRLLRELGMADEARAEANAVWQEIRQRTRAPGGISEDAPDVLEYRGGIYEARGEDLRAAEMYVRRITEFVRPLQAVQPAAIAPLRDGWVGRAYAACMVRSGQADAAIAALQKTLDRPAEVPCGLVEERTRQVLLALLLEARGQHHQAEARWSALTANPALALGR